MENVHQQSNHINNIVLVCGLPGVGKSSLVRNAIASCPSPNNTKILVYIIEYDALYSNHTTMFDVEEWKKSREEAAKIVEQLLRQDSSNTSNILPALISEAFPNSHNTSKYILIDDNLFYKSMRRSYYNLAREYNAGFAQVHVSCPISECLSRNRGRENPVPDNIIHQMYEKFEHPDSTHDWESHTIQLSSHPIFNAFPWKEVMHYCAEPVQVLDESEKDANRVINLANLAHQFDLQARKAVSSLMQGLSALDPPLDPKKVRALGKVLSVTKQQHVSNIHKLETKCANPQVLAALLQDFQRALQEQLLIINTSRDG